jgi:hypothetical protein
VSNADLSPVSGTQRRWRVGVSLLAAALAVCVLPGVADAAKKKSKPDRVKVGTYNLYLGANLDDAVAAGLASDTDGFVNEVGAVLRDVSTNNFPLRAKTIAARINKKKLDLVGLQEAALWRQSVPTDGAAPPVGPGTPAQSVVYDYLTTLLVELNRKAKTAKQCKAAARKAKGNGKKPKPCYRGYRLVVDQQEANVESYADLDNDPGPDGIGGAGPFSLNVGLDDTGQSFGEPPDGGADSNGDGSPMDCYYPTPPAPFPSLCLFHGVDGDVRLTMRDAILARKGAGVGTSGSMAANYTSKFSVPVFGGAAVLDFLRGWTSTEANVRGKKFRFLNTHLESESNAVRSAQASELVKPGGPVWTQRPTVLVGDLNSDPNGASPGAYNVLAAAGFQSRTGPGLTSGHGELLTDSSNLLDNSRIDHILTNSPRIGLAGSSVFDVFRNGLWASDHGGVESRLNVPGKKKNKKK